MDFSGKREDEKELISIIIPVFQVERYLDACLTAVVNQSYRKLEILLIDDGSTDDSGQICERRAAADARIIVVHQENRGLSAARNEGLRRSKGSCIAFVDADDIPATDYIEHLYRILCDSRADIAVCDYTTQPEAVGCSQKKEKIRAISSGQMLRQWHGRRMRLETVVWNKLYRREILLPGGDFHVFPEGSLHEDVYVSHLLAERAGLIAITSRKLYYYRKRTDSISRAEITRERTAQLAAAQQARLAFFQARGLWGSCIRLRIGMWRHRLRYFGKIRGAVL